MDQAQHHPMELVRAHEGGAEEWLCPACSRRILMRWAPGYHAQILAPGDARAYHTGGSAGQQQSSGGHAHEVSTSTDAAAEDSDSLARLADGLRPWQEWLNGLGWSS